MYNILTIHYQKYIRRQFNISSKNNKTFRRYLCRVVSTVDEHFAICKQQTFEVPGNLLPHSIIRPLLTQQIMSLTSAWGGAGKGLRQSFANILAVGGVELHSFRARSCAIASNRWRQQRISCNLQHTVFCWRILWVAIVVSVVVKLLKSLSNAWLVHSFVVVCGKTLCRSQ